MFSVPADYFYGAYYFPIPISLKYRGAVLQSVQNLFFRQGVIVTAACPLSEKIFILVPAPRRDGDGISSLFSLYQNRIEIFWFSR